MRGILKFTPHIVTIGLSFGFIIYSYAGEIKDESKYDKLRDEVVKESQSDEIITEIPNVNNISSVNVTIDDDFDDTYEAESEEAEEVAEEVAEEIISNELLELGYDFKTIDFDTLKQINDDVCSWVELPGTSLSYPVAWSSDESNDYYLHHDIEGKKLNKGTIFIDNRCDRLDENVGSLTVSYGHRQKDGSMYKAISNYQIKGYINKHPFIVVYTPDGYAYKATVIGGYVQSGKKDAYVDVTTEDKFYEYVKFIKENSNFETDIEVEYGDKLMSFVTCEYSQGTDSRYILVTKLEKQYTNEMQISNNMTNSYVK